MVAVLIISDQGGPHWEGDIWEKTRRDILSRKKSKYNDQEFADL